MNIKREEERKRERTRNVKRGTENWAIEECERKRNRFRVDRKKWVKKGR
jgi:hypothetical protein